MNPIAKFFKLQEHGTTFQREILGGITTFLAMSYILFVQPACFRFREWISRPCSRPLASPRLSRHC